MAFYPDSLIMRRKRMLLHVFPGNHFGTSRPVEKLPISYIAPRPTSGGYWREQMKYFLFRLI